MRDPKIITVTAPINIGIIKYFDDPIIRSLYPVNDYLTAILHPSVICAKTSVCASREFTTNEFWMNGKRDEKDLPLCLNEVKYCAATQRTVTVEFLKWKVHVACENNFLPASGLASYTAGFMTLVTALCKLYKISPKNLRKDPVTPDFLKTVYGGFVQRRTLCDATHRFTGTLVAKGADWPDLRVLILVVDIPGKETSAEDIRGVIQTSEHLNHRLQESLPKNFKAIIKAIKKRDFGRFAETVMKDNNEFHSINVDTLPSRTYKTEISHKIAEVIHVYNDLVSEVRAAYVFDTGPNATLFFLKKHAQAIISLIKYVFPSSEPLVIVPKGVEAPNYQFDENCRNFPLAPMERDQIKFAVYTKVGDVVVQAENENHLLYETGNLIVPSARTSPSE